jgi:hyperosmotically inducible protein
MTGQTLGTNIDNKTTTATVKTKLTADTLHNLTWVDVDTNDGVVYLTGTANSEAQKSRATEIARSVTGVKRVVNNIDVRPAAASSSDADAVAASPGNFMGQHTMIGQVTSIDHNDGHLTLKTDEGTLRLHFPPSSLSNVQSGDRVSVELGIRPAP